jgi:hypothetical protein
MCTEKELNTNREKTESLKKAKNENVAGSVWLNLFMDSTGKCKLPFTHP